MWARTSGTTAGPIEGPSAGATLVQLSDDGRKVLYLSGSDTYVHDVRSGTALVVPNVRGVAIDPTGRYLLPAPHDTNGPSLTLRDIRTGTDEIVSNQPSLGRNRRGQRRWARRGLPVHGRRHRARRHQRQVGRLRPPLLLTAPAYALSGSRTAPARAGDVQ